MMGNSPPVPCELAARAIVPTVRAMLAKELTLKYTMKQQDVAYALGLTQSAISQYLRNVRGTALHLDSLKIVEGVIKEMAEAISNGSSTPTYLNRKYCEICRCVRQTRLLCELHQKVDPEFDIDGCNCCDPELTQC